MELIKVIFKNRDLTDVFNDRWKANHNKNLEKKVRDNKINIINRSYGLGNNQLKKDNKVIGYNRWNGSK